MLPKSSFSYFIKENVFYKSCFIRLIYQFKIESWLIKREYVKKLNIISLGFELSVISDV